MERLKPQRCLPSHVPMQLIDSDAALCFDVVVDRW